jgi:hypothetical protein
MQINNDIFLEFWKQYEWPPEPQYHFRLYHDQDGSALFYSHDDLPGSWITVTPEQFALGDLTVRVEQGRLCFPDPPRPPKLVPGEIGTACDPRDITVVIDQNQHDAVKWRMRYHDAS